MNSAIESSPVLQHRFRRVRKVHVERPRLRAGQHYLLVIRNPVSRAISAFNWRHHLVMQTEKQKDRFPGEWEILNKYKTLNALAERLYEDGIPNESVLREFRTIHHLRESIAFYLGEFPERVNPKRIFAVFCAEFLDQEVEDVLQVPGAPRIHENASKQPEENTRLSDVGRANLARVLEEDYRVVEWLCEVKKLPAEKRRVLLRQ